MNLSGSIFMPTDFTGKNNSSSLILKRTVLVICAVLLTMTLLPVFGTQAQQPSNQVPTLVPPTLVPTATPIALAVAETSGVKTVQDEGVLRIGARYNTLPFSFLDTAGQITGFEVEIMQAIAVDLGVQIEWVQVTAENEDELLLIGEVDMLIGEQLHTRSTEQTFDFSHPYYLNKQMMVVRQDAPYQGFADLNGQPIGVAVNSRAED